MIYSIIIRSRSKMQKLLISLLSHWQLFLFLFPAIILIYKTFLQSSRIAKIVCIICKFQKNKLKLYLSVQRLFLS